jgi:transposase-like protein
MSESGAKGKSGTASKNGETARELPRRTKQITRRKLPSEEKIRILLEGIRAEVSVAEFCRREGIHPTVCYSGLKDFMESGKAWMRGTACGTPRRPRCTSCSGGIDGRPMGA